MHALNINVMKTAHDAIIQKLLYLMEQVDRPLTCKDEGALQETLEEIKPDTLWGKSIQMAVQGGDVGRLVEGLGSQCIDDLLVMNCVLGTPGLIYVLRSTLPKPTLLQRLRYRLRLFILRHI